LTVTYNVAVSDASTTANQTVSVTVTGATTPWRSPAGRNRLPLRRQPDTAGSATPDTTSGTLAFTDVDLSDTHQVSVALDTAVWSANPSFVPSDTLADLQTALTTALHDSTGSGTGGIDWTFSIPDHDLDFLSPGETLTMTYDVTVTDGTTSSIQTGDGHCDRSGRPLVVNPVEVAVADSAGPDAGNVGSGRQCHFRCVRHRWRLDLDTEHHGGQRPGGQRRQQHCGAYGTLFVGSDGSYSYTANTALDQLQVGDNRPEQFTITVASKRRAKS